ncbi:MAG: manno-octulosonate cytidylyltransferase [Pseudomonadota bacterium]
MVDTLIVVPARFGSSRFPGKPLEYIAGRSMVTRVAVRAERAAALIGNALSIVATDDDRIMKHCKENGFNAVLTSPDLASGSDRALAAAQALPNADEIDFVVNLQGDAPFTPFDYIVDLARCLKSGSSGAATPVIRLSWDKLDKLRRVKQTSPSSGTTCIVDENQKAVWFSKAIIPAIRNEDRLRNESDVSPVYRHIGLYAYRKATLQRFVDAPMSAYEKIEGLEQLRLFSIGEEIACVEVPEGEFDQSGIDTLEDLRRAEAQVEASGDPDAHLFEERDTEH